MADEELLRKNLGDFRVRIEDVQQIFATHQPPAADPAIAPSADVTQIASFHATQFGAGAKKLSADAIKLSICFMSIPKVEHATAIAEELLETTQVFAANTVAIPALLGHATRRTYCNSTTKILLQLHQFAVSLESALSSRDRQNLIDVGSLTDTCERALQLPKGNAQILSELIKPCAALIRDASTEFSEEDSEEDEDEDTKPFMLRGKGLLKVAEKLTKKLTTFIAECGTSTILNIALQNQLEGLVTDLSERCDVFVCAIYEIDFDNLDELREAFNDLQANLSGIVRCCRQLVLSGSRTDINESDLEQMLQQISLNDTFPRWLDIIDMALQHNSQEFALLFPQE